MNKTNLLLLLAAVLLGALSWSTWNATAETPAAATTNESSSAYRRYVVDLPRVGSVPSLQAVQGLRLVPPRIDEKRALDQTSNLERELLEGELARVAWDLVPPARRALIHGGMGDPEWTRLKVAPTLRAILERSAALVADPQGRMRAVAGACWCEGEAYAADPSLREYHVRRIGDQLAQVPISRLLVVGVTQLNQVEQMVESLQRGRPAGDSAQIGFGELETQSAQLAHDSLIQVLAGVETIYAPWRRSLRHLERLLGGTPRHGFGGFDEEAYVDEIQARVAALLDLARAEALDLPNPAEYERRRRLVVDALTALEAKLPELRTRAREIGAERAALREQYAGLAEAEQTQSLEAFPPTGPRLGSVFALARIEQGGLAPATKSFLQRAKQFAEGSVQPFLADLRAAVKGLEALPSEAEEMLRSAPRDVVLARGSDGAWRVASEGFFPASGERIDGVEIRPAAPLGIAPLSALRTLIEHAQAEIARTKLRAGGERPSEGPPPLLVALAELMASDPRGAWLPRERDYGFDENALEIVIEGEAGKVLERLRFGAPDAEAANPPPWIEGKRKSELTTRNMAYVHSFNPTRRLAYRVEWLPRIATARPNQALRAQDFLFGDRRLVPSATPENFRSVSIQRAGAKLAIARAEASDESSVTWTLASASNAAATMDEGLARRCLSQFPALFFEGVAARLGGAADSARFGFEEPRLRIELQADGFREELLFGARVRRDGKLYVACTVHGSNLGALTTGGRYAFLLEDGAYQRLVGMLDEVQEEARLLAAGNLLDANFLSAVERITLSESSLSEGPAIVLGLQKIAGLWCLPAADNHPADPARIEGQPKALLNRLGTLQRAYPFADLTSAQRVELQKRMASGLRIALSAVDGTEHVLSFVPDSDPSLGGERLANRRRSGSSFQIARLDDDDEFYLVPALELPELLVTTWLDLQWQRALEPIKAAQALRAEGEALSGASFALERSDTRWAHADGRHVDHAQVEEALNWIETLGAIELSSAPSETPWLTLQWKEAASERRLLLFRSQEGETPIYVARFPERAEHYRVSPLVIDPLVVALKRIAAE